MHAAEAEICEAARLGPDVGYAHYALAYFALRDGALWRLRAERHAEAREHLAEAMINCCSKLSTYLSLARGWLLESCRFCFICSWLGTMRLIRWRWC